MGALAPTTSSPLAVPSCTPRLSALCLATATSAASLIPALVTLLLAWVASLATPPTVSWTVPSAALATPTWVSSGTTSASATTTTVARASATSRRATLTATGDFPDFADLAGVGNSARAGWTNAVYDVLYLQADGSSGTGR